MPADLITSECSGCMEPFTLNRTTLVVTMTVPSNGRRGSLHMPAHVVATDAAVGSLGLIEWDCPRCGYAESEYQEQDN
jgi:hypothetical protein